MEHLYVGQLHQLMQHGLQIGQHIIEHADHYAIKGLEYDEISKSIENLEEIEPSMLDNVTGEDSIILTRERFMPKNGVLIESPEDDQSSDNSVHD